MKEYFLEISEKQVNSLIKRKFTKGIIAMARAFAKGETVGILTARSSKENNEPLIREIEHIIGEKIKYKYFINDPIKSERISHIKGSAARKLEIIKEFSNTFDKVKFYDDEKMNVDIVNVFARNNNLENKIKAYDIKTFDVNKLDSLFNKKTNKTIHFFDLDGTVLNVKLPIYITKENGEVIKEISQEEWATKLNNIIEELREKYPDEKFGFDLSCFLIKIKY